MHIDRTQTWQRLEMDVLDSNPTQQTHSISKCTQSNHNKNELEKK